MHCWRRQGAAACTWLLPPNAHGSGKQSRLPRPQPPSVLHLLFKQCCTPGSDFRCCLQQNQTPESPPPPVQLFFRFHLACFVGFFLLSCAHYAGCWMYFTPGEGGTWCFLFLLWVEGQGDIYGSLLAPNPALTHVAPSTICAGLLLYAADLALRAGQMSNITTVTAASVDEDSKVATLLLRADKVGLLPICLPDCMPASCICLSPLGRLRLRHSRRRHAVRVPAPGFPLACMCTQHALVASSSVTPLPVASPPSLLLLPHSALPAMSLPYSPPSP